METFLSSLKIEDETKDAYELKIKTEITRDLTKNVEIEIFLGLSLNSVWKVCSRCSENILKGFGQANSGEVKSGQVKSGQVK